MSLIKSYLHNQMNTFTPSPHLEMLMQREQLMEDIDSIVESFWYATWPEGEFMEDRDELTRVLCDAVVRNFPTK